MADNRCDRPGCDDHGRAVFVNGKHAGNWCVLHALGVSG